MTRPSYFNLFTEPRTPRRMSRTLDPGAGQAWGGIQQAADVCNWGAAVEAGEQQLKRTQSGEQQLKRMQSGEAAEADASGEQQLKRAQSGSSSWKRRQTGSSSGSGCHNRAREQQLKRTQSGRSSSAQRAVRRRITHGRRRRGK